MRIDRISIKNYRRLADVDLDVREHLVLIGANDVGKTSFLRLIDLVLGSTAHLYQRISIEDLRSVEEKLIAEVRFRDFSNAERALFHREIDIASKVRETEIPEETLRVRLEVERDPDDDQSVMIRRWCPGRGEERNPSREQINAFGWRYLPATRQVSASAIEGPNGVIQTLLQAVEPELGAEKEKLVSLLESFNEKLEENISIVNLRSGMADRLSSSMPRSINADDLAVRTSTDPSESVLEDASVYFKHDDTYASITEQSDGIRQLISMTLFDLAENAANVVAIDEPEIHLHPQSQRTVAKLLSGSLNQKIIVTHSPYIVQRFDPTQIVVVRPDGTCKQIDSCESPNAALQAHWWHPKMLEALTARYVIVVEGVADQVVVEAAAHAKGILLDKIGAVIFELGGAEKFPHLHKFLGSNGFEVKVLGLVDEKEKGKWLGAFGGRPKNVIDKSVFISISDLEDEYCQGIPVDVIVDRLIANRVAKDEQAIRASCGVNDKESITPEHLTKYCRKNKVPAALATTRNLTQTEAASISSVHRLLTELERLSEQ